MRLEDLKATLMDRFFKDRQGRSVDELGTIFSELSGSKLAENFSFKDSSESQEPSKALNKFTDGKSSLLAILEKEDFKTNALFAATRKGKSVSYIDLTAKEPKVLTGTLKEVKAALNQAKAINDDAYFSIKTEG